MKALLVALMIWIGGVTGMSPREPPAIEYWTPAAMREATYPNLAPENTLTVVALYDRARKTMILPEGWVPDNAYNLSILVHELTHHMQGDKEYPCPGAKESEAYDVQRRWLESMASDFHDTTHIGPLALMMLTDCRWTY